MHILCDENNPKEPSYNIHVTKHHKPYNCPQNGR